MTKEFAKRFEKPYNVLEVECKLGMRSDIVIDGDDRQDPILKEVEDNLKEKGEDKSFAYFLEHYLKE